MGGYRSLNETALRGGPKKVMEALADPAAQVSLGRMDLGSRRERQSAAGRYRARGICRIGPHVPWYSPNDFRDGGGLRRVHWNDAFLNGE